MKLFSSFRRPFDVVWEPRFSGLATYNSEAARGIVHTKKWEEKMSALQKEYDEKMRTHG